MWLINALTYRLEYYEGSDIPKYAILSHRWEQEEVSFQDFRDGRARTKKGFHKIDMCCRLVRQTQGQNAPTHVWVDTCCIDKTSSAELSEAINSMFDWYAKSHVCFTYLFDVNIREVEQFESSAWFTRGWTLQELVASSSIQFFDRNWVYCGSKESLRDRIIRVTKIPGRVIDRVYATQYCPVAERMSWAASRKTTRVEDQAYCLLGLLGVNMPLLYGEGERAFQRLQEEILKKTGDLSVFAFRPQHVYPHHPPLALSASEFGSDVDWCSTWTGRIQSERSGVNKAGTNHSPEIWTSDAGISLSLCMVPFTPDTYWCPVGKIFTPNAATSTTIVGILIRKTSRETCFNRVTSTDKWLFELAQDQWQSSAQFRRITLTFITTSFGDDLKQVDYGIQISDIKGIDSDKELSVNLFSRVATQKPNQLIFPSGHIGVLGFIEVERTDPRELRFFHFVFDFDFNLFCLVTRCGPPGNDTDRTNVWIPHLHKSYQPADDQSMMELLTAVQAPGAPKLEFMVHNVELEMIPCQRGLYSFGWLTVDIPDIKIGARDSYSWLVTLDWRVENHGKTTDDVTNGNHRVDTPEQKWHVSPYQPSEETLPQTTN